MQTANGKNDARPMAENWIWGRRPNVRWRVVEAYVLDGVMHGGYKKKINRLEHKIDELTKENQKLKDDLAKVTKERDDLKQQCDPDAASRN